MRENYLAWYENRKPRDGKPVVEDIHLVYPMVRWTGEARMFGWIYRCVHLEPNGDCGIHEIKPGVCAKYPYGRKCENPDCNWDEARKLPARE
jgi:Fe-S-cluster containining protein